MKCIQCGTDNNLNDRTTHQGQCKNCNHPFAFEPATVTDKKLKFTDPFFAKAIADISANDTLFFTSKQLFYLLEKRLKSGTASVFILYFLYIFFNIWGTGFVGGFLSILVGKSSFIAATIGVNVIFIIVGYRSKQNGNLSYRTRKARARFLQVIGGLILGVGILISLNLNSYSVFITAVLLGMLSIYLGTQPLRSKAETLLFQQDQFQVWVNRWTQVNEPIAKMLSSPRQESLPTVVSPDISAYSFDRAVVCDSAAIAQLLIANNFHFENNCAVLSITGYPPDIFQTVMQMLSRNPNLKVYAIHDASPNGVSLVHHLRTSPSWFQNSSAMIYDLGLLPRQVFFSHNVFVRASEESAAAAKQLPPAIQVGLSHDELVWLEAGNFVELESFSPQKVIQVLNRGIAQSQDSTATDSLVIIDDGGGYIYATDSFG